MIIILLYIHLQIEAVIKQSKASNEIVEHEGKGKI